MQKVLTLWTQYCIVFFWSPQEPSRCTSDKATFLLEPITRPIPASKETAVLCKSTRTGDYRQVREQDETRWNIWTAPLSLGFRSSCWSKIWRHSWFCVGYRSTMNTHLIMNVLAYAQLGQPPWQRRRSTLYNWVWRTKSLPQISVAEIEQDKAGFVTQNGK